MTLVPAFTAVTYSLVRYKHLPDVGELVVDVSHVVLHVDGHVGRLEHGERELLGERADEQSAHRVRARHLVRHEDLLRLLTVLQVQNTWRTPREPQLNNYPMGQGSYYTGRRSVELSVNSANEKIKAPREKIWISSALVCLMVTV